MNHTIGTQTKTNIQTQLFAWCAGAQDVGKLNCQGLYTRIHGESS